MAGLQKLIDRTNSTREMFGDMLICTHVRRLTQKDADVLFGEIDFGLSPENLTCDGEASGSHIRLESLLLNTAKSELIALGFEPSASLHLTVGNW